MDRLAQAIGTLAASCRICGSSVRAWRGAWLGFEWGRCTGCQSVQKLIDADQYRDINPTYDPGYCEADFDRAELESRMDVDEKERFLRSVLPDASGSLLDIGCGMGGYLLAGKRMGLDVFGVEPSQSHSSAAVNVFGLNVVNAYFDHEKLGRQFDAVILSHVIEHIHDPAPFLRDVLKVMRPGGKLVIVTPNCNSLSARLCMKFWSMYRPVDHVTLFSPRALARVVPRGASVERLWTTEWPGEFAAHIVSALKTLHRPSSVGGATGRPPGRLTTIGPGVRAVLALLSFPMYFLGAILDRQSCMRAIIRRDP